MFTDYKIKQRHELLARTIGVKQEEEASLSASNILVITATVCMIVFSILEIIFYRLYNCKVSRRMKGLLVNVSKFTFLLLQYHPWEKIINGEIVDYDAPVDEEVVEEEVNKKEVKVEIETSS